MRELTRLALFGTTAVVATVPSAPASAAAPSLMPATATVAPATQSWRTASLSRENDHRGENPLRTKVAYGGGEFILRPIDADLLYEMEISYDEDVFEPLAELTDDLLELGIERVSGSGFNLGSHSAAPSSAWTA